MKGKRKAAANPVLNEAMEEASKGIVDAQFGENNVGEERERDGDDNGVNREETEGEDEDDEEEEKGEGDGEGEGEERVQEERPKLDEGFFEIEAIRRKRIRKGQLQYFIKWRGWPETANTWEPLENLQSCSDVIDAFEESLQSGKSSRKRKRKYGGPHTQPKKKQPHFSVADDVMGAQIGVDKPLHSVTLNNSCLLNVPAPVPFTGSGHEEENNGDINNGNTAKQADENGSISGSKLKFESRVDNNEYDPKLSELRGTLSTNDANADKLTIHFQEGKASEGDGPTNRLPMVDYVDPVQSNRRTGSKRRKSGSVKRFKKDSALCEPVFFQNSSSNIPMSSGGTTAQPGIENANVTWGNSNHNPVGETSSITKIVKPISFSASVLDNVQDVLVTFEAMRADGKEVIVDNKFLKATNPLLLINFYEQHLKYST